MPSALLEVAVKAVACRGGGEEHAFLREFARHAHSRLHILCEQQIDRGIGDQPAYALSAVWQENYRLDNALVQELAEHVIRNAPVHAAEDNAVRAVERVHRRDSRLGNGADAVVDVLHTVYLRDIFQTVLQTVEFGERIKTLLQVRARLDRRCESHGNIVNVVATAQTSVDFLRRDILAENVDSAAVCPHVRLFAERR